MTDWAEAILRDLWNRVDELEATVGQRFPLYADQDHWRTTARGSWTGGFWAGLLALCPDGDPAPVRHRLDLWADADTVCRGLIFWYGSAGERLGLHPPQSTTAAVANNLAQAFDDRLGAIPWGTALAPDGPPIRPDGAVGVVPLLRAHGHVDIARRHLETHLAQGIPGWNRGAAWLLLSAVDGDMLNDDLLAPWSTPSDDAGANAIAAAALIKANHPLGERLLREAAKGTSEYDGRTGLRVIWAEFFTALAAALLTGLTSADQW
ncbi:unsaturated chondroitin disaccharide hydrolase [Actinokineospora baliensis]|uniref:hypothetical protein n=1 Tax=Actinokineospora baliensis TaxID=547056 RepID=UPI0019581E9F|nr:hypothetical protein [Actinokineospora baliensis]MBM7775541.1 unsaturated chondroitin disaccharide hydrolase [Actinokineospora baliensis]